MLYWAAAVTELGREYFARIELERLGFCPYLPEIEKLWRPRGATEPLVRASPLFPGFVFLPLDEARKRAIWFVTDLRRPAPLHSDADGRIWRVSEDEVVDHWKVAGRGLVR